MLPPNLRDYYLEIRCPRCGARARWEEPFAIGGTRDEVNASAPGAFTRPWGRPRIREKFPSLLRWTDTRGRGGWHHYAQGVVRCPACHLVALHRLRWPGDAFFRWNVRGTPLWAWHAEHAQVLHDYLAARVRDPFRYPHPYPRTLQRLPRDVLAARSRERVARRIASALADEGIPLTPPLRPRSPAE